MNKNAVLPEENESKLNSEEAKQAIFDVIKTRHRDLDNSLDEFAQLPAGENAHQDRGWLIARVEELQYKINQLEPYKKELNELSDAFLSCNLIVKYKGDEE